MARSAESITVKARGLSRDECGQYWAAATVRIVWGPVQGIPPVRLSVDSAVPSRPDMTAAEMRRAHLRAARHLMSEACRSLAAQTLRQLSGPKQLPSVGEAPRARKRLEQSCEGFRSRAVGAVLENLGQQGPPTLQRAVPPPLIVD